MTQFEPSLRIGPLRGKERFGWEQRKLPVAEVTEGMEEGTRARC